MTAGSPNLATRLVVVAVAAFYLLAMPMLGIEPIGGDLDASWSAVLAWGLSTGKLWGEQLLFTYGPLGALQPEATNFPETFWLFFSGQMLVVGASAWLFASAASRLPTFWGVSWLVLIVVWQPWIPSDVSRLLVMLLAIPALGGIDGESKLRFVVAGLLLTTMALIKFNAIPVFVAALATASAIAALEGRPRRALIIAMLFPVAFVLGWLACGQDIAGLASYLRYGIEFSKGYSKTMQLGDDLTSEAVGFALLVALTTFLAAVAWRERRESQLPAVTILSVFIALIGWKSFYARADGHITYFYCLAALLPTAVLSIRGSGTWLHFPALLIAVAATFGARAVAENAPGAAHLALVPTKIRVNAARLADPWGMWRERLSDWASEAERNALPAMKAAIGDKSVDVFMYRQRVALLNGFNYAPRPIFQSYAAYTPALAAVNERYFLKSNAPDHVIVRFEGIDNRLTMQEDGLAQTTLLRRYRPMLVEKQFLLARRDPDAAAGEAILPPSPDSYRTARFGEAVDVPAAGEDATLVFLDVEPTWIGKLLDAGIREPVILLEIGFDDGSKATHRLVRPTAASGFVISPMLAGTTDWISLYSRGPTRQVRTLRLTAASALAANAFRDEIRYAFRPLAVLHAAPGESTKALLDAIYPGFDFPPSARAGMIEVDEDEGRPILQMHSPSSLTFAPGPTAQRLRAEFGLRSIALTAEQCAQADGFILRVSDPTRPGEAALYERHLNPFRDNADRGPQTLDVEISASIAERRILVEVLPGANIACDWSYVRNVRFTSNDVR